MKEVCKVCGGTGKILVSAIDSKFLFAFFGWRIKRKYKECSSCKGTGKSKEQDNETKKIL